MTWGIKYAAMDLILKGAIITRPTYRVPVWIEAMKHEYNRRNYISVQRLINISMAKAYRNTSGGAFYIVTATIPITIKIVEIVKR